MGKISAGNLVVINRGMLGVPEGFEPHTGHCLYIIMYKLKLCKGNHYGKK